MFSLFGLGRSAGRSAPAAPAASPLPASPSPLSPLPASPSPLSPLRSPRRPSLSRVPSPAASPRRSSLAPWRTARRVSTRCAPARRAEDRHIVIGYVLVRDPLDLLERGERGLLADTHERLLNYAHLGYEDLCELVAQHGRAVAAGAGVLRGSSHLHENAAVRRNKLARDAVRLELREFLKELG
ncbi:hypothetical protein T492DRAFT_924147 [Pavlovales sp. CCMP2436]|nr:hypothetical protein T492DRAFT_924147 [Pavlovales sp. CCMP2436]